MGWLLYSNLHIAFVAAGLILGSYALVGVAPNYWYVLLAACGALLVYHADRALSWSAEDETNSPQRVDWLQSHGPFVVLSSVVCIGLAVWSLFHLEREIIEVGVVLAAVGLFYNVPIPVVDRRLKDTQGFRILLIIGCWTVGGVYLPLHQHISGVSIALLMGWKAAVMVPNVLMAEWVDRKGDAAHRVRGTGSWLGRTHIIRISLACLCISLLILWQWRPHAANGLFVLLEGIGLVGLVTTITFGKQWHSQNIVMLDAWVGFPIVIWLTWVLADFF